MKAKSVYVALALVLNLMNEHSHRIEEITVYGIYHLIKAFNVLCGHGIRELFDA